MPASYLIVTLLGSGQVCSMHFTVSHYFKYNFRWSSSKTGVLLLLYWWSSGNTWKCQKHQHFALDISREQKRHTPKTLLLIEWSQCMSILYIGINRPKYTNHCCDIEGICFTMQIKTFYVRLDVYIWELGNNGLASEVLYNKKIGRQCSEVCLCMGHFHNLILGMKQDMNPRQI